MQKKGIKSAKQITAERNAMYEAVVEQLDKQGLTHSHYRALADDYADLYVIKEDLINDLKKRGVMTEYQHGGGQSGWKSNDSLKELPKIIKAMSGILMELGLRPTQLNIEAEGMEI